MLAAYGSWRPCSRSPSSGGSTAYGGTSSLSRSPGTFSWRCFALSDSWLGLCGEGLSTVYPRQGRSVRSLASCGSSPGSPARRVRDRPTLSSDVSNRAVSGPHSGECTILEEPTGGDRTEDARGVGHGPGGGRLRRRGAAQRSPGHRHPARFSTPRAPSAPGELAGDRHRAHAHGHRARDLPQGAGDRPNAPRGGGLRGPRPAPLAGFDRRLRAGARVRGDPGRTCAPDPRREGREPHGRGPGNDALRPDRGGGGGARAGGGLRA